MESDTEFGTEPDLAVSQPGQPGKRRRLLWLSGAALLLVILAGALILIRMRNPAAVPIPAQVGGLSLTSQAFGKEAAEHIAHLHGKDFPLTGAAVGEYGDGQVTLWVSRTLGRRSAQAQIRSMTDAIAKGTSPFEPIGVQDMGDCIVYTLTGMGQNHFYFSAGDQVIWLAVAPDRAEAALSGLLDYFAATSGC